MSSSMFYQFISMLKLHTKANKNFCGGTRSRGIKSEPVFKSIVKKEMNEHSLRVPFQCCKETKRQICRN